MPSDRPFPVAFAVTPRFDVFYALYTLTNNAPSVLERWRERALVRLPRDFERVAKRVAPVPLFWPLLADSLQRTPGEMTFDEIVSNLRQMPLEDLKVEYPLRNFSRHRDRSRAGGWKEKPSSDRRQREIG